MADLNDLPARYHFSPQPWKSHEFRARSDDQHWLIRVGYVGFFIAVTISFIWLLTMGRQWGYGVTLLLAVIGISSFLELKNDRICSSCKRWDVGRVVWKDRVTDFQNEYERAVWRCKVCGHEWKTQRGDFPAG
jgi:rubredoxin